MTKPIAATSNVKAPSLQSSPLTTMIGLVLLLGSASAFPLAAPAQSIVSPVLFSAKDTFLDSLTYGNTLNEGTKRRTELLNDMISNKMEVNIKEVLKNRKNSDSSTTLSAINPGSLSSFLPVAPGTWKVVYAPHMTTIAKLAGGLDLDVEYIMHADQTIESHAKFSSLPLGIKSVYLSVSGKYDSISDTVCSVEWDEAWVKLITNSDDDDKPYAHISDVPDSLLKNAITNVGKLLFIRPFSIFPVSFLATDLTVFDFEALGTRICARKVAS
jgi:hypothetical protein